MSKITKDKSTNNKPETPRKDNNTTNEVTELKAIVESLQSRVTTLEKKVGTLENKVEDFDFEYDKIHRHRKANGSKQNIIVRFRPYQYPLDYTMHRKKLKTAI